LCLPRSLTFLSLFFYFLCFSISLFQTRKRRIKAFIRADLVPFFFWRAGGWNGQGLTSASAQTFKSLMERGKAASASPEDAQRVHSTLSPFWPRRRAACRRVRVRWRVCRIAVLMTVFRAALYSKYRDIYLPILHPAVEKPIQLDPRDVRADADWAEEEGVKRAYTEAQRLRSVTPSLPDLPPSCPQPNPQS